MTYKSVIYWPKGSAPMSNDITTDKHQTKSQAQAVCDILEKEGMGCDGKIFPLFTNVISEDEEVERDLSKLWRNREMY